MQRPFASLRHRDFRYLWAGNAIMVGGNQAIALAAGYLAYDLTGSAFILSVVSMGFAAPMREWMRGDFGRRAESQVLGSRIMERGYFNRAHVATMFRDHLGGRRDNALHLWTLFNLAAWYDHWIDGG